jgi:hypothetical protein
LVLFYKALRLKLTRINDQQYGLLIIQGLKNGVKMKGCFWVSKGKGIKYLGIQVGFCLLFEANFNKVDFIEFKFIF